MADNVSLFDSIINAKHGKPDALSIQQIVIPSQMNIFTSIKYSHDSGLNVICIRIRLVPSGRRASPHKYGICKKMFICVSYQVISLNSHGENLANIGGLRESGGFGLGF